MRMRYKFFLDSECHNALYKCHTVILTYSRSLMCKPGFKHDAKFATLQLLLAVVALFSFSTTYASTSLQNSTHLLTWFVPTVFLQSSTSATMLGMIEHRVVPAGTSQTLSSLFFVW